MMKGTPLHQKLTERAKQISQEGDQRRLQRMMVELAEWFGLQCEVEALEEYRAGVHSFFDEELK